MKSRKDELQSEIAAARSEAISTLSTVSREQLERPSPNEGWSVKDTLAHISSIENRLRSMWQFALDGREWPADDADINAYNARCVEERRSWSGEALLDELNRSARETDAFIQGLVPSDLDRTFSHPTRGTVSLESLITIVPRHLRAHAAEIKSAVEG